MASRFPVNPGWVLVLRDLGIRPENVMRRAGLPDDHLTRAGATITAEDYAGVFWALEAEADDPGLPIELAEAVSFESFDPAVFAAMCSRDLDTALTRLSLFKPLCAPVAFHVTSGTTTTDVRVEWLDPAHPPPPSLTAIELAFIVRLSRLATRARIEPVRVTAVEPPSPAEPFAEYFGVPVERGADHTVAFSAADARRPFLTAREEMWSFFEPELRRRLAELDADASTSERVRSALLRLLPSGRSSLGEVARELGVSARTLQRNLRTEQVGFQQVLNATREQLARHYLRTTEISGAEISFLLGYEDPNSFFRAFHAWTGQTPAQTRAELRASR